MNLLRSALLLSALLVCSVAGAQEWRGWRGLEKQACADSGRYPVEWSADDHVLWKVNIGGEGHSSPVINNKYVVVTAAELNTNGATLKNIAVKILTLFCLAVVLYLVYVFLRNQKKGIPVTRREFLYNISFSGIFGLLLFSFAIMYWMYFGEWTLHKTILNYFFSGSVAIFCILMLASQTSKTSFIRIIAGVLIIALSLLLFKYRPRQDYFLTSIFFSPANIWLLPASFSALFIPVLISAYLIFITFYRKLKKGKTGVRDEREFKTGNFRRLQVIVIILGAAGFLAVPAITLLKYYFINVDALRIRPPLSFNLFVDPGFAYPFFMVLLWLFFFFWFITDRSGKEEKSINPFAGLILTAASLLFFFMLNVMKHEPEYERIVYCIDREKGEVVWKEKCLEGPAVEISNYNSQATPTPLIDEKNVYAYFGGAGMVSFDIDGRLKWENRNLPYTSPHGAAASPVFFKNDVVLLNTTSGDAYVTALDDSTGSEKWRKVFPASSTQTGEYRTPVFYKYEGHDYLVEWSSVKGNLLLYDASTGEIAFKFPTVWNLGGEAVTTPVILNNIIFLASVESVVAVDLGKVCKNEPPVVWETGLNSRGPETSSPVIDNGMIYIVSDTGTATCLDCNTGKILWQKRLGGAFLSSPVAAGHRIYFSNNAGLTTVVESAPEFRQVSKNDLKEGIYATPALVDGRIFIRTKNSLWCIK